MSWWNQSIRQQSQKTSLENQNSGNERPPGNTNSAPIVNDSPKSSAPVGVCRDCGSHNLEQVYCERISDVEVISRERCRDCGAEHLTFVPAGQPALILVGEDRDNPAAPLSRAA